MRSFNVICGLPRAGSTLLCNILNQHEEIQCSGTSPLPGIIGSAIQATSVSDETRSMLIHDQEGTEQRISRAIQGIIQGWYMDSTVDHVFDKSRGWPFNMRALKHVSGDSLAVVTVRDPRDVIASIHKQDNRTPTLDQAADPLGKTIFARTEELMLPNGLVGQAILGVEDMVRRGDQSILFLKYEEFVKNPTLFLNDIVHRLGLDEFEFDLENVENTAPDVDGVYLNKFPHEGSGKVCADNVGTWSDVLDSELAEAVRNRYPYFGKTFGY